MVLTQVWSAGSHAAESDDSPGAGEEGRTPDLRITNPAQGQANSMPSGTWVCRTRQ